MSRIALVYDEGVIPEIVTDDPALRVIFIDNIAPDGVAFEPQTVVRRVSREAFNMLVGKPIAKPSLTIFAAAGHDSAPPIRPMSVSGRADLGSSGGSESCVLGRAEISEHGQPRQPDAHGSDAGGNPTKLGAPVTRVEGPHPYLRTV